MKYTAKNIRDNQSPEVFSITYVDDYFKSLREKNYKYQYGETFFSGDTNILEGDTVVVSEEHINFRYECNLFSVEGNRGVWENLTYHSVVPNSDNKLACCLHKSGKVFAIPFTELIIVNKILM